jgi:hypothetical protein
MVDLKTLEEARDYVDRHREFGVVCPCCDQKVRLTPYRMDSSIAASLLWLVQTSPNHRPDGWVHVPTEAPDWVITSRSYSKARFWGLLEKKPKTRFEKKKRTSGMWRPTQKGIDFIMGKIKIPSHVYTFNRVVKNVSAEDVDIYQALGTEFDYEELMKQYSNKPTLRMV